MILRQCFKLVSVAATKRKIDSDPCYGSSFLTAREIEYCQSTRHCAERTAARLAVKQALLSLYRVPSRQFPRWYPEIEVCKKKNGRPFLKVSLSLKKKFKLSKNQALMLSLAHERTEAMAWVALVELGKNAA